MRIVGRKDDDEGVRSGGVWFVVVRSSLSSSSDFSRPGISGTLLPAGAYDVLGDRASVWPHLDHIDQLILLTPLFMVSFSAVIHA